MKVLLINGSCNASGCTFTALSEAAKSLAAAAAVKIMKVNVFLVMI